MNIPYKMTEIITSIIQNVGEGEIKVQNTCPRSYCVVISLKINYSIYKIFWVSFMIATNKKPVVDTLKRKRK